MEKLIYVDDSLPGITRRGAGTGFAYYDPDGQLIRDRKERARLNAIALPPAYRDAWFCPASNGHILATGYDDRRRKQYRYHPDFRRMRDAEKFDRCLAFGKRLPLLRKRLAEDFAEDTLAEPRVIAAVVRLLDLGAIRVGNEGYAQSNRSFGATTLRKHHARVDGDTLLLNYRAKGGKERAVAVDSPGLSDIVRELQDLGGQHLFSYREEGGATRPIQSSQVNDYLRETMGQDFSAKNFRTWHASRLAFSLLAHADEDLTITAILEHVAERLGNTPSVTRSAYIHPAVIEQVERQGEWRAKLRLPRAAKWLSAEEKGLISLLEQAPAAEELLAA